jgi:hypothetical protein
MLKRAVALGQMKPALADLAVRYEQLMDKAGLKFGYTSVARSYKEQIALYSQGREIYFQLCNYRAMAGLPALNWPTAKIQQYEKMVSAKPGNNEFVVTWTYSSKHIINLDDSDPNNNLSEAFDIVLIGANGRTPHYDVKISVNRNKIPDYLEAAQLGTQCSYFADGYKYCLNPGGLWTNKPDLPHYQLAKILVS